MPFLPRTQSLLKAHPFAILFAVWLIPRMLIWSLGNPVIVSDSTSYLDLASKILDGKLLNEHDGFRTPGLPLLIIACGFNFHLVWFVHSLMVFGVSWMSWRITAMSTQDSPWAVTSGIALNLSPLMFYEAFVMTEITTMFFSLLALYAALNFNSKCRSNKKWLWTSSLALVCGVLVRPTVVYLIPIVTLFIMLKEKGLARKALVAGLIVIPTSLLWLSWSYVTYRSTNVFSFSIMTGYALAGHSGPILSKNRPQEWEHVARIYSPLENSRLENPVHGTTFDAVWDSRIPLNQALGLTNASQNALWTKMSLALFRQYPKDYLVSVVRAWPTYWTYPKVYKFFDNPQLPLRRLLHLHGLIYCSLNWIAVGTSVVWFIRCLFGSNRWSASTASELLVVLSLFGTSIFITLLIPYPLGRHALPTVPLTLIIAGTALTRLLQKWTNRSSRERRG